MMTIDPHKDLVSWSAYLATTILPQGLNFASRREEWKGQGKKNAYFSNGAKTESLVKFLYVPLL